LSDALWCGCPGVVLCGDTFAARVSASIAVAAGIPEIVTHSLADYERLLCELALQPQRLVALRARVQRAREISPLFDSAAFARDLEKLYEKLVEQSRNAQHFLAGDETHWQARAARAPKE
jgi:predicted O-linked N-acetylglucosamine transferase (SPINDLY family)